VGSIPLSFRPVGSGGVGRGGGLDSGVACGGGRGCAWLWVRLF
jgi:hypothetical protein